MSNIDKKLGLVTKIRNEHSDIISGVHDLGFNLCHLSAYNPGMLTDEIRDHFRKEMKRLDVEVTGFWAGWSGHVVWDFVEGPITTGLVPPHLREERVALTKYASDFAASLGVKMVMTHIGFVPEDCNDSTYKSLVPVVREIAEHCRSNGQDFCFETGQETPTTLLRLIEDVGMENVGVNFDAANLIVYGKANPVDAIDILAPYIRQVHIKDGLYPVDSKKLGKESQLGEGQVDHPALLRKLVAIGFDGPWIIETEFQGDTRNAGILKAKDQLKEWLSAL
ncbi:sugar phosphate isomerase/epimerase family protein [Microvirga brassicacearum]|uniref:Sugar phosphate isomerase/epimerase n=1 Tax=Microvirga brassicacearum TaxID=2580413 RepID=A0A5N3P4J6_9HYPH|nr:sugar phosphate isomerase/epimerase family protein [Microvirga brassicacearum]KAB0264639.1 sugar phosphate isomerase/epimerase [Microvirga brassicacearum]